uniref:GUN4 domain-containing protein n=1 Tax=Petrachloros mirabilis TaxID=2918835 RepID=UPI0013799C33|nr:GUN4 domain-containing protein [Petrachloros mirabilis]
MTVLFPLPLLALTIILVILPTVAAIWLRILLHQNLVHKNKIVSRLLSHNPPGIKPDILTNVELRYKSTSDDMENVNTIALISSAYGQEEITFLGINVSCEQAEYFSRILPNLLLALGLLGTFLGITGNLYNIGDAIRDANQPGVDISVLVQQLLPQLQGMGIAFFSSLIALVCSSLLTIVNFFYNTAWEKYQLISSLEDYLDNIYKSKVQGQTRLDKAVDRMVKQQEEFLLRFHEKVGQVLEETFGKAANQIANESSKLSHLAEQVYSNFSQASGTIRTGADMFRVAARSLESQTQTLANLLPHFEYSSQQLILGSTQFLSAAEKIENANIIDNLERITSSLSGTQEAFTQSTMSLESGLEIIMSSNVEAAQLAEKVYSELYASISEMQQGSAKFLKAANIIDNASLALALDEAAIKWTSAQQDFSDSTSLFCQSTQSLQPAVQSLHESSQSINSLSSHISSLEQEALEVSLSIKENITSRDNQFIASQQSLTSSIDTLNVQLCKFESDFERIAKIYINESSKLFEEHSRRNIHFTDLFNQYFDGFSNNQQNLLTFIESQNKVNDDLTKTFHDTHLKFLEKFETISSKIEFIIDSPKNSTPEIKNHAVIGSPIPEYLESDFEILSSHLASDNWREADLSTFKLILKAIGQSPDTSLTDSKVDQVPADLLVSIDQLWMQFSQEKFGLSAQHQIWQDCIDSGVSDNLAQRVGSLLGWHHENDWLYYDKLNFKNIHEAPKGHFPARIYDSWDGNGVVFKPNWVLKLKNS